MAQLLSDYIFEKKLNLLAYKICLRNETSHTVFTKSECIFIRELKDDGLIMEVQPNICQKGHNLTLFFVEKKIERIVLPLAGHMKEAFFVAMAKVQKIDVNQENESVFVELRFTQYDQSDWKNIVKLYEQNQDQINDMLEKQHKTRENE